MPSSEASAATQPLAQIVAHDRRAARVLTSFGLDFCCGGRRTLKEACTESGIEVDRVVEALAALGPPGKDDGTPDAWNDPELLIEHIVARHHTYLRKTLPVLSGWLETLVARHGAAHPELAEVQSTVSALAGELTAHLTKEETILFPCIRELASARRSGAPAPSTPFGTMFHPIRVMEDDHHKVGELLLRLRELTSDFHVPDDGCVTYRACYGELERLESDLHQHVHLENNLLFPRALDLERGVYLS